MGTTTTLLRTATLGMLTECGGREGQQLVV